MRIRTALTPLATLLLAAVALAACGGSSNSSSQGTSTSSGGSVAQTAYGKQLARVCKQAKKELAAAPAFPFPTFNPFHPDASKLPAIGRFFERTSLPDFEKIVIRFGKVQPPPSARQNLDKFRAQLDGFVTNLKRQIAAAKSSDVRGFIVTVKGTGASTSQLPVTEASLDVPACSGIP
jgi:hypothetical protein